MSERQRRTRSRSSLFRESLGQGPSIYARRGERQQQEVTRFTVADMTQANGFMARMHRTNKYECVLTPIDAEGKEAEDALGRVYLEFPSHRSGMPVHRLDKTGKVIEKIRYENLEEYLSSFGTLYLDRIHGIPSSFPDMKPMVLIYDKKK